MKASGRILAVLLLALAAGCVGHVQETAGGSLELWLSDYEQEIFQGAIEEFQETYPEVELNITAYSSAGSVVNTMRQMQTQLMGGDGPDLASSQRCLESGRGAILSVRFQYAVQHTVSS